MASIYRPCYCTREEVMRALDIRQAAYSRERIDRAVLSGAEAVDSLTQRKFFYETTTHSFDWPNYQYAYPWRIWLDNKEMAGTPSLFVTGSLLPIPVVIPVGSYIMQPINSGPPWTYIELRRDTNSAFGYNETPQLDIAITGPFGYWQRVRPAGSLAATVSSTSATTVTVSDGVSVGVGDTMNIDSERMIVTGSHYIDTTISFAGLSTAQANDNIVNVADGTQFAEDETIQVDSEWLLIQSIQGNNLIVKRGWDASVLSSHTGGTIWARRSLSVLRGALGSVAATHTSGAAISVDETPGLIRQLAIAEAVVWLSQEPGAYGGASAPMQPSAQGEPAPGAGLPDLRNRVANSHYSRKARTRVI
jgi:hypothetical protein